MGEPNDDAVLRATMTVTAFCPGVDAPSDVDDAVELTLQSQRPMIRHDSIVEMQDCVGALETAVIDCGLWLNAGMRKEAARYLFSRAL